MELEMLKIVLESGGAITALYFVWKIIKIIIDYKSGDGKTNIEERLENLEEEQVDDLEKRLENLGKIKTNDLSHVRDDISSIRDRINDIESNQSTIVTEIKHIKKQL